MTSQRLLLTEAQAGSFRSPCCQFLWVRSRVWRERRSAFCWLERTRGGLTSLVARTPWVGWVFRWSCALLRWWALLPLGWSFVLLLKLRGAESRASNAN